MTNYSILDNSFIIDSDKNRLCKKDFTQKYPNITNQILDYSLNDLSKKNKTLLVYPRSITKANDLRVHQKILETKGNHIWVSNLIGFIGCGDEELIINSRFYNGKNKHDYFLYYMLSKVYDINPNIVDLKIKLSYKDRVYSLLIFLFNAYLQAAIKKGILKQYKKFKYNDANVKGLIDINRHIKHNIPFNYKIAYNTRELSYNNDLTQLIRHTIECISLSKFSYMLKNDNKIKDSVDKIVKATPDYKLGDRLNIINKNSKNKKVHSYFSEYDALKKLCMAILKKKKHSLHNSSEDIYGIIFDVSCLWEEYLNNVLEQVRLSNTEINNTLIHPNNRNKTQGVHLFEDKKQVLYPDFYYKSVEKSTDYANGKASLVIDAKYKILDSKHSVPDYYQLKVYADILGSDKGLFIYPSKSADTKVKSIGTTVGNAKVTLHKLGLAIPQNCNNFDEFKNSMQNSENSLKDLLSSI